MGDLLLIIVLLVGAFLLFKYSIRALKKELAPRKAKKAQAKNIIEQSIPVDFNREATVRCKYIQGIDQLFSNQGCQIVANETNVTIHAFDNTKQKIILEYSNILAFSLLNELSREFISTVNNTKYTSLDRSLGIKYKSKDGVIDILFSLDNDIPEIAEYNENALAKNNIFNYVNDRICKDDNTIVL